MAHAARLYLRLQKELKLLLSDPPPGVSFPLLSDKECTSSSLSNIVAQIEGPEETVYAKGIFTVKIQIPERYPFHPPIVAFATPIYHPNIDNGGRICLDILNLPPKGAWQPSLNISTVLTSICLLLTEPNPDDGLMVEASREYKYNRHVFDLKARSWTEKYAHPGASRADDAVFQADTINMGLKKGDVCPKIEFVENKNSRKKLRLASSHASEKKAAIIETENEKEIVHPTQHCGIVHDKSTESLDRYNKQLEEAAEMPETIVVSDSEESEDESQMIPSSRFSLLQKKKFVCLESRRV